ncbi:MAG: DUF58 domain-containing protein [Pseudanabaena sp. ELA607]
MRQSDHSRPSAANSGKSTLRPKSQRRSWWQKFMDWLAWRLASPEFSGGMLLMLAIFFFGSAINTLAGWLYVISGVMFALIIINIFLPGRVISEVLVERPKLDPVSAGDELWIEVLFRNRGNNVKSRLEIRDSLPDGLSNIIEQGVIIDNLVASYTWRYQVPTLRRGVFYFEQIEIATASPFGLYRSRRNRLAKQKAIVYPVVLPIYSCPLLDNLGNETNPRYQSNFYHQSATEGLTRTLRAYRWGDSTRFIHWRTSAKIGELQVRELEITNGGQEVVIALDTHPQWSRDSFEEAVVTAATLYFYALRQSLNVRLWLPEKGLLQGDQPVLEGLAAVRLAQQDQPMPNDLPALPTIWLTARPESIGDLPLGSRWLCWDGAPTGMQSQGITIETTPTEPDQPVNYQELQTQLQAHLTRF